VHRFIRPDVRTLTISDGDTLVVRARLTAGERRAAFARMWAAGVDGARVVDPLQVGLAKITAYLLDWSLTDDAGRTVAIRELAIVDLERVLNQLSPESFEEIADAIEAHEQAMTAEREAQKKTSSGPPASAPISSSPFTAAGGTNGSGTSTPTSMIGSSTSSTPSARASN